MEKTTHQNLHRPEQLIEENAAGRTISSVARTSKGDIVGHNALFEAHLTNESMNPEPVQCF